MIRAMNHFTVLAEDLDETLAFYVGVLGLEPGPRPDLGFPGAWLYASGQAVLHVVAGRSMPEPRGGVLDHMAFSASGLGDVKRRLEQASVAYTLRRQTGSNLWQLFCVDPSGARVELDFDAAEAA